MVSALYSSPIHSLERLLGFSNLLVSPSALFVSLWRVHHVVEHSQVGGEFALFSSPDACFCSLIVG